MAACAWPGMSKRLAVIGCGNMGQAIVRGLLAAGKVSAANVVVTNPNAEKAAAIAAELGVEGTTDNGAAAASADIVLLGVKPQIIRQALDDIGDRAKDALVLSIAAGIGTATIEKRTGSAVVRCMPNLAVTVGHGSTAISAGAHATADHMATARAVFESVGIVEEVPEDLLDAVTGLSGTGPMYVFYMIEALSDAGVKVGLSRGTATRLAKQTVLGSAKLAMESDAHPAALKDMVSSPGGTSITALHVLRQQGFAAILMDAVEAATNRSAELGE